MLRQLLLVSCCAGALLTVATSSAAQESDVIRGQVTGTDGVTIQGANVTARTVLGGVNRAARTDRDGRFTITFPGGEGHYFLEFTAVGYVRRSMELRRVADEAVLVADVRLRRLAIELDTVEVVGPRPRPRRSYSGQPDVSGTEESAMRGALSSEAQGDLNQLAGSVAGATTIPGADGDPAGFSILGLPMEQSEIALNGMGLAGTTLPRDASVSASLVTTPYDVSRGGFSGGQLNVRPAAGSNFVRRTASITADPASLTLADRSTRALGLQSTNLSLGGLVSGPIVLDRAFYNVSYQLDRRTNPLRTLLNTAPDGLQAAGIAADSGARLVSLLNARGIPLIPGGRLPSDRVSSDGKVFGTVDFLGAGSGASHALNLTFNASWRRQSWIGPSSADVPSSGGRTAQLAAGLQVNHSAYVRQFILNETTLEATTTRSDGTPFLELPRANVLVRSEFADGSSGIRRVAFGGNPSLSGGVSGSTLGLRNQSSWVSRDNRHRIKATGEVLRLAQVDDRSQNLLGTFGYESLEDVENDRPASFVRSLLPQRQQASAYLYSLSLGDSYRPRSSLQVQYGVRLDGTRFPVRPELNTGLRDVLQVRNDRVPDWRHLSPRIGFAWTHGSSPEVAAFEGASRLPRSVVRGGVGVFQGTPTASLIMSALRTTGLASGAQQIRCVGEGVPSPDWEAFMDAPANIPRRCADGTEGTVFGSTAPDVQLFSPGYVSPRSVRGNLQWSGPVLGNRLLATVEGIYSHNVRQPGFVDLNVAPAVRFGLPDEGGRPVFVLPGSIVASTGAIATRDARRATAFDQVIEQRSDLSSTSRQFRLAVSPAGFSSSLTWNAAYVYARQSEQFRGFTSSGGDPFAIARSPGDFDVRHQLTATVGYNAFDVVRVSGFLRVASGTPFTPLVSGDINGDGYANDRAFVFDAATGRDSAVTQAMARLLAEAPSSVRTCVRAQQGTVAARNSCRGPWTANMHLTFGVNPTKVGLSERVAVTLDVANPLGAVDRMLHGQDELRGWGEPAMPDRVLLLVRGFDPAADRFVYAVNPRFGSVRPEFRSFRTPPSLAISVRVDVGPSREQQTIIRQLDQGRRTSGERISAEMLHATYQSGGIPNPILRLLREGDSLRLRGTQADSLTVMNVRYMAVLDSLWRATARELAALPEHYDRAHAYRAYRRAREASIDALIGLAPHVLGLLTEEQRRRLPPLVASYLDRRYLRGVRSGTIGDSGAGVFSNSSTMRSGGVSVRRTDVITIGAP
jgi:hypothetical protein